MSGWRGRRWRGGGFREVTHAHVLARRRGVYAVYADNGKRSSSSPRRRMTTVFSQCPPMVINDDEPDGDFHRRPLFRGLRGYRFARARSGPEIVAGSSVTSCGYSWLLSNEMSNPQVRISLCVFATPRYPATPRSRGAREGQGGGGEEEGTPARIPGVRCLPAPRLSGSLGRATTCPRISATPIRSFPRAKDPGSDRAASRWRSTRRPASRLK